MMSWLFVLACVGNESYLKDEEISTDPSDETDQNEDFILAEWYGGIQPVVAENCASCHTEGGVGPFAIDTYEVMAPLAAVALASIESGSMPPWMPDTDCNEFMDERSLTQNEIDAFKEWVESGTPEGDDQLDLVEPPESFRLNPSISLSVPGDFLPDTMERDEYRCFVLDVDFEEETYIVANDVIPGSGQVHHVLIYALNPEFKSEIIEIDDSSERLGYSCFGTPYPDGSSFSYADGLPNQIGAWVPSIDPVVLEEGMAFKVEAGSPIIMQVHYSALGGEPTVDTTTYEMVFSDVQPEKILSTRPLAVQDLDIPAGESNVVITQEFGNYRSESLIIRSLAGHMHLLGTSIKAKRIGEDGESCLLDIPEWDFGWQQSYSPITPVEIMPYEKVEVTCEYDNSAENQPIVDGVPIEPSDVSWGDGTLDEMCLLYVTLIEDYVPPPPLEAPVCYEVDECFEQCEGDLNMDCLLNCEALDVPCFGCVIDSIYDCALTPCGIQSLLAKDCLEMCYENNVMLDGSFGRCMSSECPTEYEELMSCIEPKVTGPDCSIALESCNITF